MKNIHREILASCLRKRDPAKDLPAKILWEEESQRSEVVGFENKTD